jgi:hypothetical protein
MSVGGDVKPHCDNVLTPPSRRLLLRIVRYGELLSINAQKILRLSLGNRPEDANLVVITKNRSHSYYRVELFCSR